MRLLILTLLLPALVASARPIHIPSYSELQKRSDAILLLEVSDIRETSKTTDKYPLPEFYKGYLAKCNVLSVFKGEYDRKDISVLFFQHPDGRPGFNGAVPAPFSLDKRVLYIAYLKHDKERNLVPLTGHYDAGLSIKTILKGLDYNYLKLPKQEKKAEPAPGHVPSKAAASGGP